MFQSRFMFRLLPGRQSANRRSLSANEAAIALRPFYFAVHPDRFGREPEKRSENERSLQAFNGYLNGLYNGNITTKHVPYPSADQRRLKFYVWDDNKKGYCSVELKLAGDDPDRLVRSALESCHLSTGHVPKTQTNTISRNLSPQIDNVNIDMELVLRRRRSRKPTAMTHPDVDFVTAISALRNDAISSREAHKKTRSTVECEIDDLKQRTGLLNISWNNDWTLSHIRSKLLALNRLFEVGVDKPNARAILHNALFGHKLKFGRNGSYISCDGCLHLAVDEVPQQWISALANAPIARAQLSRLFVLENQFASLLGGAIVVRRPDENVAKAIYQLETLIKRLSSKSDSIMLGHNVRIDVNSSVDSLTITNDGRLMVPVSCDASHLSDALRIDGPVARARTVDYDKSHNELIATLSQLTDRYRIAIIDYDSDIDPRIVIDCCDRIDESSALLLSDAQNGLLADLHLYISSNSRYYVMNDGRLSIPVNCKF